MAVDAGASAGSDGAAKGDGDGDSEVRSRARTWAALPCELESGLVSLAGGPPLPAKRSDVPDEDLLSPSLVDVLVLRPPSLAMLSDEIRRPIVSASSGRLRPTEPAREARPTARTDDQTVAQHARADQSAAVPVTEPSFC
jgi:hypothetical protein